MKKKFLIIDSRPYGLFSIFLHTIDNIKWAEDNGYTPVVRWGPGRRDPNYGRRGTVEYSKDKNPDILDKNNFLTDESPKSFNNTPGLKHCQCLYWSEEGFDGEKNPWLYYFEPLNKHTVEEAEALDHDVSDIFMVGELNEKDDNKFLIKNIHLYEPLILWDLLGTEKEHEHRKAVNDVIQNNIKIKENTLNKANTFWEKYSKEDQKTIAVHIRGTDKKLEYPHKALPISAYKEAIANYLETLEANQKISLYIASDNNEAIGEIIQDYKSNFEQIIVYPSVRMPKYFSKNPICLTSATGPKHGQEVLIETLLLSKCSHLICTDSNVSAAAIYMNPTMSVDYLNRKYGSR